MLEYIPICRQIQQGEGREAQAEGKVPGFMAKGQHPQAAAGGAPQQGEEEQPPFRDPPGTGFGSVLIQPHSRKGKEVPKPGPSQQAFNGDG